MTAKISLSLRKFRYARAKIPIFYAASCILQPAILIFQLLFLHPRLDEIDDNSYELGIDQQNFDGKLDMMVEGY